ncbi:ECs_2282 family putative zinc-binding protein [Siccibacter turicensis]|uniref:ECs_2282 family putative zinc-binding protein n=1 Tax=Siccibacter turicensis TaxID=357233 RepID=UPI0039C8E10E
MPNLKFVCPVCSGTCFHFTTASTDKNHFHGAACAACGTRITAQSCIPKKRYATRAIL